MSCRKPTLAMIHGYCLGGGLGVALCCDLRFAADNASFSIPAAKLGLGYAYDGVKRLVDVVGPSFAKEIFYTGRQFTAAEASSMRLVNRVLPSADLLAEVTKLAFQIGTNAPLSIVAAKRAVDYAVDEMMMDITTVEQAVAACFASDDYREGRCAFVERRTPRFTGR